METAGMLIAGDLFPREQIDSFAHGDVDKLFSNEIVELFRDADFSVCNLEGALTDADTKCCKCGQCIKAPPETGNVLKALGVDYVSLANNHSADFRETGMRDTIKTLETLGVGCFGAAENIQSIKTHITVQIKGLTIIFYAVAETIFNIPDQNTPGSNLYDEYRVCKELEELKKQCDYLFVLYHGGVEFFQYPTPWARQRFHRMADSGADVIIAQHTHCIGTEEYYGNAYLLYGQGNFCFHQLREKELANSGLLLQFVLSKDSIKILKYPVRNENGKVRLLQELPPDLEIRNRRLANGESFQEEFSKHAEKFMTIYILEIRGHRFSDRILRKLLGKERFLRYLRRCYKDNSVLRMLELVRAEEHSEIMQRGLADFYSMRSL